MKLKCCEWEKFKIDAEINDARFLIFGAGAIGQVSIPEILKNCNLLDRIDCYIDNNTAKWGTCIETCGKRYEIKSPKYLEKCDKRSIILLCISRFYDAVKQLEDLPCTENMDCYVMPMMLIHNFCVDKSMGSPVLSKEALIPKKIHYMWLGRKPLPERLSKCIESWKQYCPDYEIIEWNENNYDINKHPYMKNAYDEGAFGFVPDYARIDILYNEGGFYLDTDVEMIRNIEPLRHQTAFCGVEKWQILNFGGMSGSVKGHSMLESFLNSRKEISFYNSDGRINRNTCGYYDTKVALAHGYKINGETQYVDGMNIYSSDYFHPFDYMSGTINKTENTYSVHWFNGGWLDEAMKKQNEEARRNYMYIYKEALKNN